MFCTHSRFRNWTVFLVLVASVSLAQAADEEPESDPVFCYGGETDLNSRYVWRGVQLSDGAVLQPSVWASSHGIEFSVWGNLAADGGNPGTCNELDLTLGYGTEFKGIAVEPEAVLYLYPNQEDVPTTAEFILSAGCPIGLFELTTSHAFDFVASPGSYAGELGLGFESGLLTEWLAVQARAGVGWASARFNEVNMGVARSAVGAGFAEVSLTAYPLGFLYVRPHLGVSSMLDRGLCDALVVADLPVTGIHGGIALGVEF